MRLLMTTDTVGGVWTFTQELAVGLLDEGCSVTLVSMGRAPTDDQLAWANAIEHRWQTFHYQASCTPLEWMQENDRAMSEAAPLLVSLAQKFGADLLHSNQFCFGALPVCIPKVLTAHSDVMTWSEACRVTPLPDSSWMQQYRSLLGAGLRDADAVIAPTRWMLHALARHFPLPQRSHIIPNGREITSSHTTSPRRLQAVTAGRLWDEAKGIALLRNVASPIPILVAGDTACEGAQAPRALGGAQLLGSLAQASLLELFEQSAIYICTSRYEPFGLAPLEAALCGCAVLASDLPSLREVWEDGALYFHDAATLSGLLCALESNDVLLKAAQARSVTRARSFSRQAMVSSYLSLYRSLVHPAEKMADVA